MSPSDSSRPRVLIIGAGLGGLTLGALLEKARVPYEIYERSTVCNPIGSAIALSPSVMPMFKQLGIYDQLVAIAKPVSFSRMYDGNGKLAMELRYRSNMEEKCSFPIHVFARPALYDVLLAQIPKEKIRYSKKLVSQEPTETGVLLHFSDGTTTEGNILVGADGANSMVRTQIYKELAKLGTLPASDKLPLGYSSISLVGQTKVLDPEKYPLMQSKMCVYDSVIGRDHPLMSVAFPTAQNTICWMVIEFLEKEAFKSQEKSPKTSSEWGSDAAEEMSKREEVRATKFPGLNMATVGDLVDLTPRELMSKVMLEEKVFKSWTHERAVLLGDACHKMSPSAGQGAVSAMLDALVLANYIETLRGNDLEKIKTAFKAYRKERFPMAKAAVENSATTIKLSKKGVMSDIFRSFIHNVPDWLWEIMMAKMGRYRPQAAFLPAFDDKGTVRPSYQPSLHLEGSTRPAASAAEV